MLSPLMIKAAVSSLQLSIRDEAHLKQLMDGLCCTVNDSHLDNSFDSFAFAWGLLPQWAKVLLLSVAYRECKHTFQGVTPLTPIESFNDQQRAILSIACDKSLTATVTLLADYHFTDDFYRGWLDARRTALQPHIQNTTLLEQAA